MLVKLTIVFHKPLRRRKSKLPEREGGLYTEWASSWITWACSMITWLPETRLKFIVDHVGWASAWKTERLCLRHKGSKLVSKSSGIQFLHFCVSAAFKLPPPVNVCSRIYCTLRLIFTWKTGYRSAQIVPTHHVILHKTQKVTSGFAFGCRFWNKIL